VKVTSKRRGEYMKTKMKKRSRKFRPYLSVLIKYKPGSFYAPLDYDRVWTGDVDLEPDPQEVITATNLSKIEEELVELIQGEEEPDLISNPQEKLTEWLNSKKEHHRETSSEDREERRSLKVHFDFEEMWENRRRSGEAI
jgi:hypothetical protein